MYSPASSKVIFHSRMEMLFLTFFPTNSTRSRRMVTSGDESTDCMVESHTWKWQWTVSILKKVASEEDMRRLSPSGSCHYNWTATWSKGLWCQCSWSRCRATSPCCHLLPPGSWSSPQTSPGPERTTNLNRQGRWQENEAGSSCRVKLLIFLGWHIDKHLMQGIKTCLPAYFFCSPLLEPQFTNPKSNNKKKDLKSSL